MFTAMDAKLLVPRSRTLQPEDVAEVVRFLCSPGSDLIQGQTIIVDGGAALGV
jgi:NAD(P)-dependent dehydrogenase (short-subunit alcohol dehydrogenase family)